MADPPVHPTPESATAAAVDAASAGASATPARVALPEWAEALTDGVVLIEDEQVTVVNAAAADMLQIDRQRLAPRPLMAVLRDHRIEAAYSLQQQTELSTRGRHLVVVPFAGGLVLRDVTAQRRAVEEARELLAVLSHELRTPVTTIVASLEALQFELPEGQRARWMQRAFDEGARVVRLLEDLTVDVAPPRARSCALHAVIEQVSTLLAELRHERGQVLELEVPAGAVVWSDPDKLLQVLLNLVENALLHGPENATVVVSAEPDPERQGWWWIEVRDCGAAESAAVMETWFAPHSRGEGATSRGTGLGLYIVRSIASRWGGRAAARVLPNGKAFGFSVPRAREHARDPLRAR